MTQYKCVHFFNGDKKFFLPFQDFIQKHFNSDDHFFFILPQPGVQNEIEENGHTVFVKNGGTILKHLGKIYKAERLILHSAMSRKLIVFLALQPWLLNKCYWLPWGKDLYAYNDPKRSWRDHLHEALRAFVFKRVGYIVTSAEGDVELARRWYDCGAQWIRCFNYPSNLFEPREMPLKNKNDPTIILAGNSADPSNNHALIFEKLVPFKDENIEIYCQLSYGDRDGHAAGVIAKGQALFGDKFKPITDFTPYAAYMDFLARVDIGIFAHQRQQALGTLTSLLGYGKAVFLHEESTLRRVFDHYDIKVFDLGAVNIQAMPKDLADHNRKAVEAGFSEAALVESVSKWAG